VSGSKSNHVLVVDIEGYALMVALLIRNHPHPLTRLLLVGSQPRCRLLKINYAPARDVELCRPGTARLGSSRTDVEAVTSWYQV